MKRNVLRLIPAAIMSVALLSGKLYSQGTSTGLIPINDLKTGYYKTFQGGLYPGGTNTRPFSHDSLGLAFARRIIPMDTLGVKDTVKGKYVLLSIGMSNTTQEYSAFKAIADTDKSKNPRLAIIDGAQGGQTASIIANPQAHFWTVVMQRLQQAGLSARQVTACWLKEADASPTKGFPQYALDLSNELVTVVKNIKQKFPNCVIVYLSGRTYGGYATSVLNPEPYAYESGFSNKWLIERQISGDTALTCTGANAKAPWLAWGPYLWADGLTPRSDGLTWTIDDFVTSDRTHPSDSGRKKVAGMLLSFLKTDATAAVWFTKNYQTGIEEGKALQPGSFWLYQNYPNPFNPSTRISYTLASASHVKLEILDPLGRTAAILADGEQSAGSHEAAFNGSEFSSGIYFCRLRTGSHAEVIKMILAK